MLSIETSTQAVRRDDRLSARPHQEESRLRSKRLHHRVKQHPQTLRVEAQTNLLWKTGRQILTIFRNLIPATKKKNEKKKKSPLKPGSILHPILLAAGHLPSIPNHHPQPLSLPFHHASLDKEHKRLSPRCAGLYGEQGMNAYGCWERGP